MKELIVTPAVSSSPGLSVTDDARHLKEELLEKALPILAIRNEKARDYAITVAGNIKAHLKDLEASRVEVKKPFLDTSREIDSVAGKHRAELELELFRINRLVGQFEVEREEALRLQRQTVIDEEKRLAEITSPEKNPAPTDGIDLAAALAATLAAEDRVQAAEASLAAAKIAAEAQRPTGGALRKDWDIEIIDIQVLCAAHRQCVTLTPNIMAIKDLLKIGIVPAGVRATPKAAYNARAATGRLQ